MKISATEEHGLRCLMHLAEAYGRGRAATIAEVSAARGMTPAYVAKMIAILRRGGLVRTARGSQGGLHLARPPETITLGEAMKVLAGQPIRLRPCVEDDLGRYCEQQGRCRLQDVWKSLNGHLREVLGSLTLASLVTAPDPASNPETSVVPLQSTGVSR